jgi:hypothetical protein
MALGGYRTVIDRELVEQARRLEELATALPGIRGAKVEVEAGVVTAVRLLVVAERDTETTIAQVRSIASAELDLDLDPGAIQVLRTARPLEKGKERPRRRKLTSLTTERAETGFRARVTLEIPGDVLVGEDATSSGEFFESRSVAQAVLGGLRDLLDFPVEVEAIEMLSHGLQPVAMVTLNRGSDRLVGTAFVRRGEHDAVARATLDALNRFLGTGLDREVL